MPRLLEKGSRRHDSLRSLFWQRLRRTNYIQPGEERAGEFDCVLPYSNRTLIRALIPGILEILLGDPVTCSRRVLQQRD